MQVPTVQPQALTPSYNAVKIDVNNPQVNAPGYATNPQPNYSAPVYNVPKQSVYEVPNQSIYNPTQGNEPKATPEQPSIPAPVIVPTTTSTAAAKAPVPPTAQTPVAPAKAPEAAAQKVEVKAPQNGPSTGVDVNGYVGKLSGSDLAVQEKTLEDMANMVQNKPEQAKDLLDTKVMDALTKVIQADTSKMQGPSPKQLEIRDKMAKNQPVTDADKAEANKVTQQGQAELNKKYAIFTTALMQKLYGDSVEKMNNSVVPITDLPGAAVVVEQVKSNPNPVIRSAGIDALSFIQRPEYKKDLNTIFTLAQKDQNPDVQKSAKDALDKLAQVKDPAPAASPAPAKAQEAPVQQAPKAAEAQKTAPAQPKKA